MSSPPLPPRRRPKQHSQTPATAVAVCGADYIDTPQGVRIYLEAAMGDTPDNADASSIGAAGLSLNCSDGVVRFTENALARLLQFSFELFSDLEHTAIALNQYWTAAMFRQQLKYFKYLLESRERPMRPSKGNAKAWLIKQIQVKTTIAHDKALMRLEYMSNAKGGATGKYGLTKNHFPRQPVTKDMKTERIDSPEAECPSSKRLEDYL